MPCLSKRYDASSNDSVASLIPWFVEAYSAANQTSGHRLDSLCLEVRNVHAERLPLTALLVDFVNHGDDLILYNCPSRQSIAISNAVSSFAATKKASTAVSSSTYSRGDKPAIPSVSKDIKAVRQEAQTSFERKAYRTSRLFCEEALKIHQRDAILHLIISKIFYENKSYDKAAEAAERAVGFIKVSPSISGSDVTNIRLHYAKCLLAAGQFEEADVEVDRFFNTIGGFDEASRTKGPLALLAFEGLSLHAECLFEIGRVSEAAAVINHGLANPIAEDQPSLLRSYAYFALKYNKYEDAIRALLKVVVIDRTHKRGLKLMGEALRYDGSPEIIFSQVPANNTSAVAFHFLANIAKDHSAIKSAIALLEKSLSLVPDRTSFLLSLVHLHEITYDFDKAIKLTLKFWIKNRLMRIGSTGKGVSGKTLAEILELMNTKHGSAVQWVVKKDPSGVLANNIEYGHVFPIPSSGDVPLLSENDIPMINEDEKEIYSDIALDGMALVMAIVKILFLKGELSTIPEIIEAFEPTRRLSRNALHETTIRNENAYYSCIGHVLSRRPMVLPQAITMNNDSTTQMESSAYLAAFSNPLTSSLFANAAKNPIFIVGDSHILPLAWQVVEINGQHRLLYPKLVTGIKHWHLRSECDFYPKTNFYNAVNSLPAGAEVIFVIGEIDCREGILYAVEKDRYKNLQEGMTSTVKLFVTVLKQLMSKKKFLCHVHPVLPMMDITASMVTAYNSIYKSEIDALQGAHWLDFLPGLVTDDGLMIREELKMDGTHINPSYISFVQEALQRV